MHRNSLLAAAGLLLVTVPASQGARKPRLFTGYDPSPAYPFGRLNPKAPAETAQFAFMIGEFDCVDALRQPDGSWQEFPAVWNARYFLNGCGIQDEYWSPRTATSNVRLFDSAKKQWVVTYFQMPRYSQGVWRGAKEGDKLVMRQKTTAPDGSVRRTRLTFYDITDRGYKWVGESIRGGKAVAFWRSTARRRR